MEIFNSLGFLWDFYILYIYIMGQNTSNPTTTKSISKEKFGSSTKSGDDTIIFILADWCGHCMTLKNSGEIEKIEKDVSVLRLDDKHPETKGMMDQLGSRGYPTIAMMKNKKLHNYSGPRTASAIMDKFKNL
jgi:thiol-disulfide isomerase/thioredoxin